MSAYIEPYIIYAISLFLCHYQPYGIRAILLMLCAIISISLLLVSKHSLSNSLICLISIVLAVFFPEYMVFIPALSYSAIFRNNYKEAILYAFPGIISIISSPYATSFSWFFIAVLSTYMAILSSKKEALIKQNKILRDTAVEHELALKLQNRKLIDGQNDRIYIATLQERNRIAREIHDNVGHMLSRAILQVGALIAVCSQENIKPMLISLKDTLDIAMTNIRNSVHDLHDESIDLSQSLANLCRDFEFCPVDLQCDIGNTVPKDIKYCFITITKEALNNIMKHSDATKVEVTVKEHPGLYQLLIEDNGQKIRGRAPDALKTDGIGLSNMQERVEKLNGFLHFQTENGFKIFISIPKDKGEKQ